MRVRLQRGCVVKMRVRDGSWGLFVHALHVFACHQARERVEPKGWPAQEQPDSRQRAPLCVQAYRLCNAIKSQLGIVIPLTRRVNPHPSAKVRPSLHRAPWLHTKVGARPSEGPHLGAGDAHAAQLRRARLGQAHARPVQQHGPPHDAVRAAGGLRGARPAMQRRATASAPHASGSVLNTPDGGAQSLDLLLAQKGEQKSISPMWCEGKDYT